ncbi:unnamed protein product [Malus baccata var. baccata]
MAYNVFGNPITDETLKGMPEYVNKQIRKVDRAHVALNMKNAAEKDFNARTYVEKLKEQYGGGVSTLCLVYNATGDTISYWGAFLHVKTAIDFYGSTAAVVYRGLNNVGEECDWMLSWSNPLDRTSSTNTVYTQIREHDHFKYLWSLNLDYLARGQTYGKDTWNGCVSIMSTGIDTHPIVEAILTFKNPWDA